MPWHHNDSRPDEGNHLPTHMIHSFDHPKKPTINSMSQNCDSRRAMYSESTFFGIHYITGNTAGFSQGSFEVLDDRQTKRFRRRKERRRKWRRGSLSSFLSVWMNDTDTAHGHSLRKRPMRKEHGSQRRTELRETSQSARVTISAWVSLCCSNGHGDEWLR